MDASGDWLGTGWTQPANIENRVAGKTWAEVLRREINIDGPGVYRLLVIDPIEKQPCRIQRICDKDPTGTLYVGAASNLSNRMNSLVRTHSFDYKSGSHTPMIRKLTEMYQSQHLFVSCKLFEVGRGYKDQFDLEYKIITSYVKIFGEPPPLNGYGRYPPDSNSNEEEAIIVSALTAQNKSV